MFLKLQYYSYNTGSCTHSQAAKWRVLPPCASFHHVTSQWPLNTPPPPSMTARNMVSASVAWLAAPSMSTLSMAEVRSGKLPLWCPEMCATNTVLWWYALVNAARGFWNVESLYKMNEFYSRRLNKSWIFYKLWPLLHWKFYVFFGALSSVEMSMD